MTESEANTDERPDPREDGILDWVFELLGEGPLSEVELISGLGQESEIWALAADQGLDALDVLDDLLWRYGGFWTLPDDRIASVEWILDGLVLTHRVTAEELEAGVLEDDVDLGSLEIDHRGMPLGDGSGAVISQRSPIKEDAYALAGPDGWLNGFQPGDLVALRRDGEVLRVESVVEPGSSEAVSHTLLELTVDRRSGPGVGTDLFPVVFDTLAEHRERLRAPHLPLTDLIRAAGLSIQGEHLGPADEDWEPEYVIADRELRARLTRTWNLDTCCDDELDRVIGAWSEFLIESKTPDRRISEALTHGSVAHAFLDRETSFPRVVDQLLPEHIEFATALVQGAGARAAGAFLFRALIHDFEGRVLDAEADLERALTMDGGFVPALLTLAEYTGERGDVRRALSLLRRAGLPAGHPTVLGLNDLLPDYSGVGRNDSCPCGSGRKFKVCCQQHLRIAPGAATKWLMAKIGGWVAQHHRSALVGLASSAVAGFEFEIDDLIRMAGDPFILDLAVFEAGLIGEYLEERGPLLTTEDRGLVTAWSESAVLRLWEVTDVAPDQLVIRADDEIVEVPNPTDLRVRIGDYLLARVGPSYDRPRLLGEVLTFHERYRDRLMWLTGTWPDPDLLASWYGDVQFPPTETNREGHRLVDRLAWLSPPGDPAEVEAVLDGRFERIDEGWRSTVEIDRDSDVRATLAWDGDTIRVETDSEERMASVLVALANWIVVDQEWPDDDLFEMSDSAGNGPS
jgi:hypothetical protein